MIYILFILMFLLLIIIYKFNDKEISSPAFAYHVGFTVSVLFACLFANRWGFVLSTRTFLVLLLGSLIFFLVSYLVSYIVKRKLNKKEKYISDKNLKNNKDIIVIKKGVKIFLIVFSILFTILELFYIVKSVGGNIKNIQSSIYAYRNLTTFQNKDIKIPFIIDIGMGIIHCLAYWILYVIINNYLINKKIDWLSITLFLVCAISNLVEGNRGAIFNIALSAIPLTLILRNIILSTKLNIKIRTIVFSIIFVILAILLLKSSALLIGRNDVRNIDDMDYIGMYTGAQIINLDILLQENYGTNTISLTNTFGTIINQLQKVFKFNVNNNEGNNFLIFRNANGHPLGNVYTIYASFILDFGYWGFIPMVILIAFLTEFLYEKAKMQQYKNNVNIIVLIYSFIYGGIIFCFFGNKLISQAISISFLKYIIMWYIFDFILVNKQKDN